MREVVVPAAEGAHEDPLRRAAIAKPRRDLAAEDVPIHVVFAADSAPQARVAVRRGVLQTQVSKWVKLGRERWAERRGRPARSAYEVAQRYAVGELTRERMLEVLAGWEYDPEPSSNGWQVASDPVFATGGEFTETVGRAADEGLISGEDYDEILERLDARDAPAGG